MSIYCLKERKPDLPESGAYWIAPCASVIGDVRLGDDASIWFGAVLRGDNEPITVGPRSNVQDLSVIHTDPGFACTIGSDCTIGHRAILHGCTIGDFSLVGMGAIVLNGAKIGRFCLIGAGALITEGKEIPDYSLVVGSPGKVVRMLDEAAQEGLRESAARYVDNGRRFRESLGEI
ncbi:gamma carbonic anhydrase family protein [Afifella marina]|uniref:Carbonic anhydrase or acetyltransferase, isoleucine patch superfamily n=1 Tax=Afifella marina DSM 2698 TaxID=1120955 RepID=A0A1G5P850_AFIMA|nr:gamma carbonic anhydrase family protein [Afifella marina]MBK1625304.1 gamma carbonic anhydrase family protein [Afifella marina DSM 2698]MBK1628846.1 gamma carbonic anhydrase family protein [Afifella marina]MBK5916848.1 gamma carbonic anhydrase family protein [Afifella marina]RAI17934.1 gamma carbonic anhydrase family protein [Afifella marina DSM 2698]SCZ45733.1 Carbonic anhydrase or acetyltransferase, isoleucine patch superfamily [Afifella marina DSM 2698]